MEHDFEPRIEVVKDVTGEEIPVLVTGQQQNVKLFSPEDFDPFREQPLRRSGTAVLTALESFVAHVNRFKDEDSIIFASDDRAAPSLTAVIDYHRQGHQGDPRFGQHRGHFAFPLSDEWKAWTKSGGVRSDEHTSELQSLMRAAYAVSCLKTKN